MLYFFYGPDTFRLKEKLNSIVGEYKAKHQSGLSLIYFDMAEDDFFRLKEFMESYSMFAEKKLAVIRNPFEGKEENQEKFLDLISRKEILTTAEEFLVVVGDLREPKDKKKKEKYLLKDDFQKKLFKVLTNPAVKQEEFDLLNGVKLENWIKKEFQKTGAKIEEAAIKKLAEFIGPDLWRLSNEISKLLSYKEGQLISNKDVEDLIISQVETDIFKTIDALAVRNKLAAFKFLHRHLSQGESEIYLLTMLAYQFRNLLLVKSEIEGGVPFYALQKKLKMHPFVLRKSFEQSKNFSFPALKKIYERLQETDVAVKTGQVEGQAALDLLVAEIVG